MTDWQPIETAPKEHEKWLLGYDGSTVIPIVWVNSAFDDEVEGGRYSGWACAGYEWGNVLYKSVYKPDNPPTHWMPLPEPPGEG